MASLARFVSEPPRVLNTPCCFLSFFLFFVGREFDGAPLVAMPLRRHLCSRHRLTDGIRPVGLLCESHVWRRGSKIPSALPKKINFNIGPLLWCEAYRSRRGGSKIPSAFQKKKKRSGLLLWWEAQHHRRGGLNSPFRFPKKKNPKKKTLKQGVASYCGGKLITTGEEDRMIPSAFPLLPKKNKRLTVPGQYLQGLRQR